MKIFNWFKNILNYKERRAEEHAKKILAASRERRKFRQAAPPPLTPPTKEESNEVRQRLERWTQDRNERQAAERRKEADTSGVFHDDYLNISRIQVDTVQAKTDS